MIKLKIKILEKVKINVHAKPNTISFSLKELLATSTNISNKVLLPFPGMCFRPKN